MVRVRGDGVGDRGWIVYRNRELLERFQPLKDLADFGLEGLFGVTDASEAPPATRMGWRRGPRGLALGWGLGVVPGAGVASGFRA